MKKGQAAMEFLMTYGWAILVVIAAIAALAYFGVLDPARLLPERCSAPAGMDCIDKASIVGENSDAANDGTLTFALRNNIAFPLSVQDATESDGVCTGTPRANINGAWCNLPCATADVANNDVFQVELNGCDIQSGEKYDDAVTVSYTNTESNLPNQAVVDIRGRVS